MSFFDEASFEEMVDWKREAKEECKTKRFCPNCCQLVDLKLHEQKHYQLFFACRSCGEVIYKKGYVKMNYSSGYRERNRMRYIQ
jgi:hypothetical protein